VQSLAWHSLSFDTWVFALLVSGYALAVTFRFNDAATGAVLLIVAFLCIALYVRARRNLVRLGLVYLAVAGIAVAPMVVGITMRRSTGPNQFAHDGMIQTEEAAKFFVAGKNPYVENYLNTPLADWWLPSPVAVVNPAVYHLVYLPFAFVFPVPFLVLAQSTLGWFDLRLIFLPLFLVTLVLLPRFTASPAKQRALVLLFALNPLFVPFLAEGRNDAVVLFWLVLSVALLQARHPVASAAAMACACATKQIAWFALPFYALYFLKAYVCTGAPDWRTVLRRALLPFTAFLILFAALVFPFFLWDSNAFVEDVFRYPVGLSEHPYPIRSLGFGGFALALGWIASDTAAFPFERLQLLFGIPVLIGLLRFLCDRISISRLWICCGILTFVISFFSRVFNDNYLGYLLNLALLGVIADDA
jgi:hypothetical protein